MRKGIVLIALALAAVSIPAGAEDAELSARLYDTGTARDVGMGGAVTAVGGDLAGVLWNPAGLAFLKQRQTVIAEALRSYPKSLRYIGYGQNAEDGPPGALSYLRVDNAIYDVKETAILYTFAQQWSPRLSLGANVKLSRFEYPGDAKEVFSFDAGAIYRVSPTVDFGVSVLNVNEPQMRDRVELSETQTLPALKAPRIVNAGVLVRLNPDVGAGGLGNGARTYRTRITMDVTDVTDEVRREVRFGVEHDLTTRLVVRAGLLSSTPTVGLGVRVRGLQINGGALLAREGHRPAETMVSVTSGF